MVAGIKLIALVLMVTGLLSCASAPPQNTANICSMFEERRSWYKAAIASEQRWDTPVYVAMAIIQQESSYESHARPDRKTFLGFIPGPRASSAFGYAQVIDQTWQEYKQQVGKNRAKRSRFTDAVDFVGWYNKNSFQRNNIDREDAHNLYLAYHEGNGGYARLSYVDKPWLIDVSQQVQRNADRYKQQYLQCKKQLGRNWFMRLFT